MMGLYFCKASSKAMLPGFVVFASVVDRGRVSEIKRVLVSKTMLLTTNQRLSGNTDKERCPQDV